MSVSARDLFGAAAKELTAGPRLVQVEHLVNELDAGSSLSLGLSDDLGISTLVCLDYMQGVMLSCVTAVSQQSRWNVRRSRSIIFRAAVR